MPDLIRVAVADDHAIVLDGLQRLFQRTPGFDVVDTSLTGAGALAAARRPDVDVMVLDVRMPDLNGIEVLRTIASEQLKCRVVILTANVSDGDAVEAIRLGALGLVLKESSPDVLIDCVRHVYRGEQWIDRQTMNRAMGRVMKHERAAREVGDVLTSREVQIVKLIAEGHRNRVIAERLSISEGTVKIHLHNIYTKLGIDGRLELLVWVQEKGLV